MSVSIITTQLNYYWRLFATGLSFLLFAVGGVLLSFSVLSFIHILRIPKHKKSLIMREAISSTLRLYIAFLKLCRLLTYETHGLEKLEKRGQLILANHPTLLDVVFLIAFTKQADCIVKDSLWKTALTRGPVNAASYISNGSNQLILDALTSLQTGNSLIIFPEGTRSTPGNALKFHRGASNIALMANKDVTPILINCTPPTLKKNDKWYHIPKQAPHFVIKVLDDISTTEIEQSGELQSKKARRLNAQLEQFFMTELKAHFDIQFTGPPSALHK